MNNVTANHLFYSRQITCTNNSRLVSLALFCRFSLTCSLPALQIGYNRLTACIYLLLRSGALQLALSCWPLHKNTLFATASFYLSMQTTPELPFWLMYCFEPIRISIPIWKVFRLKITQSKSEMIWHRSQNQRMKNFFLFDKASKFK